MKVVKILQYPQIERLQKEENFLSSLFNKVFLICKEDQAFSNKRQHLEKLDHILEDLGQKVSKQVDLLKQASALKSSFNRKVQLLEDENFKTKARLLESLGSEI